MKKDRKATPLILWSLALLGLSVFSGGASAQAPFPFSDGFESGVFGPEWTVNSDSNGRVEVTTSYLPTEGSYLVAMDCVVSGTYANNALDLAIDLTGQAGVELTYWYKEFGDEDHPEDGCFVSDDGVNFHLVQ